MVAPTRYLINHHPLILHSASKKRSPYSGLFHLMLKKQILTVILLNGRMKYNEFGEDGRKV